MYIAEINGEKIVKSTIPELNADHLLKLARTTTLCSNYSLYSFDKPANDITYIASATCNHKCCFICNWHRQKSLRRKYAKWFKENRKLIHIKRAAKQKVITIAQLEKYQPCEILHYVEYDLMHLTLTVPHYADSGFRGEKYFYNTIIELYNWMRKEKEWLRMVYGGEFGVETERKDSGMHIHIHSLLMVKKETQSRNTLHRWILKKWNRLTVNEYSNRPEFNKEEIEGIKKGNTLITDEDIKEINPKGATFIKLETIYSLKEGEKVRSKEWADDDMMFAIMETISYHFEPHAFNKADKTINIPLLAELLPNVYRKMLYRKFGCLHGEKSLNISADLTPDEIEENTRETQAITVDDDGVIISERKFFTVNPVHVFHDHEKDNRIFLSKKGREKMTVLEVDSGTEAIELMGEMIQEQFRGDPKTINN